MNSKETTVKDGEVGNNVATRSNSPVVDEDSTPESTPIFSSILSSAGKLLPTSRSKIIPKEDAKTQAPKTRATKFEVPRSERMVRVVLQGLSYSR